MSKRAYISRYLLVLKKLKAKPYSSYEELKSYIENQVEYMQMQDDSLNISFSKRTLQRDIREISVNFGIDIEYSRANKGYFISQSQSENMNFQRMMEAFDMFNSLNLAQDLSPYIHLEKRKPQGTENLYGLLHAIKNQFQIKFEYQKFWEETASNRMVEPYALKEYRNRWYIIANDLKDSRIKSFALDRLLNLEITRTVFEVPINFNLEERYSNCFGIINPDEGDEVQKIILSLNPLQGKYVKTLPLHESQLVLVDNENEFRVQLHMFITHDFIMELLSMGENVEVIKPKYLRTIIANSLRSTLSYYD